MFESKFKEVQRAILEGMTLEQVRKAMLELMMEENANHYRMGQLYNYVVEKELAQKAGYKDAKDYFSKTLADLSQTTLTTYGAVAKAFSEEVSVRYGITCLSLLLVYKEVADLKVDQEEPGGTLIEVPLANGEVRSKPFGECSVEEMRNAIRYKRKPSSSKPVPEEYMALAGQYQKAMTKRFPRGVVIKVEARNQKGDSVYDIKGIPVEQLRMLLEALLGEVPPEPQL